MAEKVCLVTGATAGLGKAIALGLAKRGATVVIVGRDQAKTEAVVAEIKLLSKNDHVDCIIADLSSQADIRELAEKFKRKYETLHVLINNAAVYKRTRTLSRDGLESMFATNHLGYFLLTNLLLDVLKKSAPASIFNVTAPAFTRLNFDDLQGEQKFNGLEAFGATKTSNLLFTFALARRLQGSSVTVNAYHPGIVRTSLLKEAPFPVSLLTGLINLFATTPERAAEGLVELAMQNANGLSGELLHGTKPIKANSYTHDEQVQDRLWGESERLTNIAQR
jgi:NAD(P)-dependent dehydrogenase (short-subunit alcohol dehydrogenase family)